MLPYLAAGPSELSRPLGELRRLIQAVANAGNGKALKEQVWRLAAVPMPLPTNNDGLQRGRNVEVGGNGRIFHL